MAYDSPGCKCGIGLPHRLSQVERYPKPVMPTVKFDAAQDGDLQATKVKNLYPSESMERKVAEPTGPPRSRPSPEGEVTKWQDDWDAGKGTADERGQTEFVQEPDKNLAMHMSIIRDLKYKLGHVTFALANARNQQHSLRKQFSLLKGILAAEVGDPMLAHYLLIPGNAQRWKGRAQVIRNLEAKATALETELETGLGCVEYNPRNTVHPDEIFVAKRQREVLKKMYDERKELSEKSEYEVDEFMNDYQNMRLLYKSSIARNKLLAEDLRNLKEHIQVTKDKSKEDSDLITSLLAHQQQMKEIIDKEKGICDQIYRKREEEVLGITSCHVDTSTTTDEFESDETLATEKIKKECEKYKAMWEETQGEKRDLEELVATLNKKLDEVTNQVIEAERHCIEQQCEIKEVKEQLVAIKEHGKALPRRGETPEKSARYRLLEDKLEALRGENQYLRSFLQNAIMTKEDDFKIYHASMEAVRRNYLRSLQGLKYT